MGSDFKKIIKSALDLISDNVVKIVPFAWKLLSTAEMESPCKWSIVALHSLANLITDLDPKISKPSPPKKGDWEEESNLDVSVSMGIGLEVISVEGTDYLAGKLNLICEGEDEKPISWADTGINENMFEGMADFMSENFTDWAENGAENGTLLFPEEIANIIKQEGDMEFYGVNVIWNEEEVH